MDNPRHKSHACDELPSRRTRDVAAVAAQDNHGSGRHQRSRRGLDWGGNGTPIVLLAGLGNTGHDFFGIVAPLTKNHHVYSITRRGFGRSSNPAPTAANYSADRLADDVIAVMDQLHIEKPILIGHSIAGEELSDIGTRYANRVSALIYLEAGYWFAYSAGKPNPDANDTPAPGEPPMPPVGAAVLKGEQSFKGPIDVPILAIYAYPHDAQFQPPQDRAPSEITTENAEANAQIIAFAKGQPTATVIRIPHAAHFVYISNKDEVLRDINAFIAKLRKT
ncbi:MAG: alpha/beta hydrolase [Candidatus Baltobacteraceae bacterium]